MTEPLMLPSWIADLPPRFLRILSAIVEGEIVAIGADCPLALQCPQDGREWFEVHPLEESRVSYLQQLGQGSWGLLRVVAFRRGRGGKIYQRRYLMCSEAIENVRQALDAVACRRRDT